MGLIKRHAHWGQQPQQSGLRPAGNLPVQPDFFWMPQMGTRAWLRGRGEATPTVSGSPILTATFKGIAFAASGNNAGVSWAYDPLTIAYPHYAGCVLLPRTSGTGAGVSMGGTSGTNTNAAYFEIVWAGFNQVIARTKMATGGTVIQLTDVNAPDDALTAVLAIARSANEFVMITNNTAKQTNTSTGSTPTGETWGRAGAQVIKRGASANSIAAGAHSLLAFGGAGDPGDEWAESWVQDPWSYVSPQRRRVPLAAGVTVYRPGSDIAVSGWTPSTGTDLFACIDETTASDADYITSPDLSTNATFGFTTPVPAGNWDVNFRARRIGDGASIRIVMLDSGGSSVGASGWQAQSGSFIDYVASVTTTGTADRFRIEVQP